MNIIVVFWLSIVAISVSATWAGYLGRLAGEKTIRHAIDKGVPLDADTIERLKRRPVAPWAPRLMVFGVVMVSIGIGILGFAALLRLSEPQSFPALAGIAAFAGMIGLGFIVAALLMRRGWDLPPT
jgi:amino acid transporter